MEANAGQRSTVKRKDKAIKSVVNKNIHKIAKCYQKYSQKKPKRSKKRPKGVVTLSIMVDGWGSPTNIKMIGNSFPHKSASFVRCLKYTIHKIQFPINGAFSRSFTLPLYFD
ncbi:MAG: hypothetical protein HRU09_17625 [Oligoflexales bacterium]|nr:hypothetical protein [Oligoflexales bacterium]